jgi:pimeloyl-ACP methyl ester carboxylesterase
MPFSKIVVALAAVALQMPSAEISADGPKGELKGEIVKASDKAPVVLIIPGSGPTDRDGNSPAGIAAAPYRLLASGLLASGITTVRIDKRGMFSSKAAVEDANAVTIDDYVTDTISWVRAIRSSTGAKCVWLLGHSEGGLVALAAAARVPGLCGIVLVATAGRPMGEVLRTELHSNPANEPLLAAADHSIDLLTAGKRVDVTHLPPELLPLFAPQVQGFLINAFGLDPARLAHDVRVPLLIVQGSRDMQISEEDAKRLKGAAPSATLVLLPDTNHVLKRVASTDRSANLATYGDPDLPLASGVVGAISDFIQSR